MSEVEAFFRFCPSCGKRFHIKLVSKKMVDSKRETSDQKRSVTGGNQNPIQYGYRGGMGPVIVEENIPVTLDIEDFQYSYKCKHCGHEWTENRVENHRVG
jgi:DNA-directed RNA polymerase subunit RPC12/RpoP